MKVVALPLGSPGPGDRMGYFATSSVFHPPMLMSSSTTSPVSDLLTEPPNGTLYWNMYRIKLTVKRPMPTGTVS